VTLWRQGSSSVCLIHRLTDSLVTHRFRLTNGFNGWQYKWTNHRKSNHSATEHLRLAAPSASSSYRTDIKQYINRTERRSAWIVLWRCDADVAARLQRLRLQPHSDAEHIASEDAHRTNSQQARLTHPSLRPSKDTRSCGFIVHVNFVQSQIDIYKWTAFITEWIISSNNVSWLTWIWYHANLMIKVKQRFLRISIIEIASCWCFFEHFAIGYSLLLFINIHNTLHTVNIYKFVLDIKNFDF